MAGRKILSEQEARRCLAAAGSSRGGLAAWARAHGIDGRSLNAWRVNLGRRGTRRSRALPKLVELVPVSAPVTSSRFTLRVGGVALEVSDDFNEATLRRLVSVLRSC